MPIFHGRNQFLTVGTPANSSANLRLTDLRETNLPLEQDLGDVTVAGSIGHIPFAGLMKGSGTFLFVADDSTNASWSVFANYAAIQQANPSNFWSANYGPNGTTSGYPKVTFNFLIKSCPLPSKVADVTYLTVGWEEANGHTISTY